MKIICLKNHLKEAVGLCEKTTGKNLSLPILNNILIIAENSRSLKFIATNLEIGIEVEMPAKVEKKGKVAIPAGVINSFISNLPNEENIKLEAQNNNLLISTQNSSTLIKGQPVDDFPTLPKITTENSITIPINDFILGLKSVWYSCFLSNIKPEISSILMSSGKNKQLIFAATDSFRLAEKKFDYSFGELGSLLIPLRAVTEMLRIFDGRKGKIKITSDKNQISAELDNVRFISRLTEGIFPDYQQIIPQKFSVDVFVDKTAFINALKTASVFSGKLNELNIILGQKSGTMTIKTSNADIGEYVTYLQVKMTGDELKMVFNHKYVFECLPHISSSKILLRFSGEGKPLLITGDEDNTFQYLIMPMNTV